MIFIYLFILFYKICRVWIKDICIIHSIRHQLGEGRERGKGERGRGREGKRRGKEGKKRGREGRREGGRRGGVKIIVVFDIF